jgi:TIR domain-containing protein
MSGPRTNVDETRVALFISHANPEDNTFTLWLGAKLAALGYEVWADILRIRGGQDWQRKLEDALRKRARKVLLVGTSRGTQKQGVRNENDV